MSPAGDRRPGGGRRGPARGARFQPEPANARALALEALALIERSRTRLVPDAIERLRVEERLDARSRRLLLELVYGVLRRRLTLDCVIAAFSRQPISEIESDCLQALRLGVYQVLFLDGIPPHAAVSEAVEALGSRHPGARGFVNGILRAMLREVNKTDAALDRGGASPRKRLPLSEGKVAFFSREVFIHPDENRALYLAQVHSLPAFLVERWLKRHDRAVVEGILLAANARPRVSARVNRLRIDREGLVRRLQSEGLAAGAGQADEAILLDASPLEAVRSAAFSEGLFYLQDEAAMKVARALEPKPGERILDLCAAPGGKATHLAELAAGQAEIVAVDRDPERLERVAENCARLGNRGVVPLAFDPVAHDPATALPEPLRQPFDAVLADVPCSNTGVLARRPEVRWRVSLDAIRGLAEQGHGLLARALSFVKPGGRLAFSTCSLEEEENGGVVSRVLVANPGLRLLRQEETIPAPGGPDGGYLALLRLG